MTDGQADGRGRCSAWFLNREGVSRYVVFDP